MKKLRAGSGPAHRITSVFVEQLFGLHTYDIRISGRPGVRGPTLLILYGDNGTGKTTILQLIYHLLGKEDDRGHRSFLARVPFRRLRVTLDPKVVVEAQRPGPDLVGGYLLSLRYGETLVAEAEAIVDPDLAVRSSSTGTERQRTAWQLLLNALGTLDLTFFLLTDDRRSDQTRNDPQHIDRETLRRSWGKQHREKKGADLRLEETVERLEKWIRDEALKASNIGEAGTNTVYVDIAKRLAQTHRPGRPNRTASDQLVRSLVDLELRSKPYASLGLVSHPNLSEIVDVLESVPLARRSLIASVISPYVESLRARLDALQDIQELVTLFLERINSFFRNKSVRYHLSGGLVIDTPQGAPLKPSQLSSGERQLFALLAEVVTARRAASVFLIDEPEISLNIKWQRVLVDTLLQLVRGTDVQFMLATHSVELLATHREHVHRLDGSFSDNRAL